MAFKLKVFTSQSMLNQCFANQLVRRQNKSPLALHVIMYILIFCLKTRPRVPTTLHVKYVRVWSNFQGKDFGSVIVRVPDLGLHMVATATVSKHGIRSEWEVSAQYVPGKRRWMITLGLLWCQPRMLTERRIGRFSHLWWLGTYAWPLQGYADSPTLY